MITLGCSVIAWYSYGQSKITVNTDKPIAEIQPTMWGIFFEDINLGADGGLYAELIKNRSFEFYSPMMGWKEIKKDGATGSVLIENRTTTNKNNPRYARFTFDASKGSYGISNEGFRGMGIKKDLQYHFSLWARAVEGNGKMRVELVNSEDESIGSATLTVGKDWTKQKVSFTATSTDLKASFKIWFEGKGIVEADMISLFPNDTWKGRPEGLRQDLVQLLADMKPGFLRFPGGCIVEGRELVTRYQWKKTVGKIEDRELIVNRWNSEFKHRSTPDYYQTFGLGFFEYFQLSEDIGASPLPILNCGMACQFNTGEVVPLEELDPYLQDALDLIEFANGDVNTTWGKLRSDLGHPAPFNLKFLGIGNEQWGPQYIERYKVFAKAIKAKYPEIKLVTSVGPSPDGELFDYLNPTLRELKADILDEHYYKNPEWFQQNASRYDNYDRKGPKIFAGEYAAQSAGIASPENKNSWKCALSEAAFMTGLERNADVVYMASYAPLFAHAEGWQWTPDLIWFNNLEAYGTANYYVQKLFASNKGTNVLSILEDKEKLTGQKGIYATAAWDNATKEIIVKLVNVTDKEARHNVELAGGKKINSTGTLTILKSQDLDAVNSFGSLNIKPTEEKVSVKGKTVAIALAPYSMTVLKVKTK
ncbi:alpha-L-arabinofuranosidase [Pseudochryseolinea flava]|uniref:non-reducing end alpha-L-arabinofuranosidase n=2 Tax=Pseudochryseolinea flava TaxID=2059302 RepID=A0A364XZB2_9BACT|nr:alpha-L-arabinofuranosidase [Pseudochryseolinea flava]